MIVLLFRSVGMGLNQTQEKHVHAIGSRSRLASSLFWIWHIKAMIVNDALAQNNFCHHLLILMSF